MNTVDSLDPIADRGLADFDAMVTRQWHALSGPGVWFDGALSTSQLVAIGVGLVTLVLLVRCQLRAAPAVQT